MSDITTNIIQRICDLPPAGPEKEDVLIITVPDLRVILDDELEELKAENARLIATLDPCGIIRAHEETDRTNAEREILTGRIHKRNP